MKLNINLSIYYLAALLLTTGAVRAQVFTDLNFEQAVLVPTNAPPEAGYPPSDPVEASAALPGWTVDYDDTPISVIGGFPGALDQTTVQMVMTGTMYGLTSKAIDGNFSVSLYAVTGPPSTPTTASISQVGYIPLTAKSIEFLISAGPSYYSGLQMQPTVTFGGNMIDVTPLSESNGVITMIGDVSEYSGKTGLLTFSVIPTQILDGDAGDMENEYTLDDISFSTQSVPEPSSLILTAVAGISFALFRYQLKWLGEKNLA